MEQQEAELERKLQMIDTMPLGTYAIEDTFAEVINSVTKSFTRC